MVDGLYGFGGLNGTCRLQVLVLGGGVVCCSSLICCQGAGAGMGHGPFFIVLFFWKISKHDLP